MFHTSVLVLFLLVPGHCEAAEGEVATADFERQVIGLLGKSGCSSGACHGSFQGKGGLRLSLFGFEPEKDFLALTRGGGGRRLDVANPDQSLLLLKATAQVPHGGGLRFALDSWQYQVLRAWIARGSKHVPSSGNVERLEMRPAEHVLAKPGESVRLTVLARFADGTEADVTPYCELRAKDESVADIVSSETSEVRARRAGDTAIVATYRGHTAVSHVFIPVADRAGKPYPAIPEMNYVDRAVFSKLQRLNIVPSDLSPDEEFLRRVTIDTTCGLPSPDEVRAFLADKDPKKRAKLIDKLLVNPLHAALWATKLCDITACNVETLDGPPDLRTKQARMWHDWFRHRFATNVPYDRIVRGVLTATSREGHEIRQWIAVEVERDRRSRKGFDLTYRERDTLDLYWRRFEGEEFFPLEKMGELTATAFLGVRLECAQCHRHPFDRWTQTDYRAFANAFGQVRLDSSPELTAAMVDLLEERRKQPADKAGPIPRMREVYLANRPRRLLHPDTGSALNPRALGGPELRGEDLREALVNWMTRADNPYFARAFVNRVWAHYFGVGLINPVDDLAASNPPSNERLLDVLIEDFVRSGYDIRCLERTVINSRTYQLSSTPNESNRGDRTNFARSYPRPMMAEVVLDVLNDSIGAMEDFGADAPEGSRAIEVATNRVRSAHAARVFQVFGRPARASTCDCDRPSGPALPQTLFLMTDSTLLKKLTTGRLENLLNAKMPDARIVDELFLASLTRFPDTDEKKAALEQVSAAANREAGLADVLWALINTREFILNH
jgi:hypothetical protein